MDPNRSPLWLTPPLPTLTNSPAGTNPVRSTNTLTAALPPPSRQPSPALTLSEPGLSYGQRTPTDLRPAARRRSTLLSLIDELSQLRDEEAEKERYQQAMFDEKREAFNDDRLQKEGVAEFLRFNARIKGIDKELQNFTNAVRQLGSSVGLLSSAYHLRARLRQLLHLFRENAAELFRDVHKEPVEPVKRFSTRKRSRSHRPTEKMRPDFEIRSDPEALPEEFSALANDLKVFLECLNQIPEFTDEAVNTSVMGFHHDLRYWASCLGDYKDQFRWPSVERYVNDLTGEMGDHLETITKSLTTFVEVGVPTIRFTQRHTADALQNLSTVATFFSAVTATTIQYSFESAERRVEQAVNLLWIVSLVFSLASAINSQLAFHWRSAIYRSPRACVPWWVSIWISRTPLFFLVVSVIAFSAGLVCFTFANFGGHPFIPIVTTVCTSISSFALLAVGFWFAGERYAFSKTKGKRWLAEELNDFIKATKVYTGYQWVASHLPNESFDKFMDWASSYMTKARDRALQVGMSIRNSSSTTSLENGRTNSDESAMSREELPYVAQSTPTPSIHQRTASTTSIRSPVAVSPTTPPIDELQAFTLSDEKQENPSIMSDQRSVVSESPGATKFKALVSKVVQINRGIPLAGAASAMISADNARGQVSTSPVAVVPRRQDSAEIPLRRPSRLATIVPALRALTTTQYLNEHGALVRHLQFSPNGEFLATCSWDQTAIIWKVGTPFQIHRKLAHPRGFVGQVAWSPDGKHLLTKMTRGVKVWVTETGVCQRTIDRNQDVQSVAWMPTGNAFISVEGTSIHLVALNGQVKMSLNLDPLLLHDVVVTPDEQRLLAVATLKRSPDGLNPAKSRKEKRIIVFSLASQEIENLTPVINEVRDITLSVSGTLALVSYEHKAPPQLFRIDKVRDHARLFLVHTYKPPSTVDFAGPSYLGHFTGTGTEDQIVLCAGKGGEVHIWDRETAKLLHSMRAQDQGSDLTGIAWNHASPTSLMFASASHDGTVRIWTAPWNGIETKLTRASTATATPVPTPPLSATTPEIVRPTPARGSVILENPGGPSDSFQSSGSAL